MNGHGTKFPLKLEPVVVSLIQTGDLAATVEACKITLSTLKRWRRHADFQCKHGKSFLYEAFHDAPI